MIVCPIVILRFSNFYFSACRYLILIFQIVRFVILNGENMFGFFKNDLNSALDVCYNKLEKTLTFKPSHNFFIIKELGFFKEINSQYKEAGLTQWGGLCMVSAYILLKILERLDSSGGLSDNLYTIASDSSLIIIFIGNNFENLNLNVNDIHIVEGAGEILKAWLDATQSDEEKYLLGY